MESIRQTPLMNVFFYHELSSTTLVDKLEFQVERKMGRGIRVYYPLACLALLVVCGSVALAQEYPPDWSVGIAIGAAINLVAFPFLLMLGRANRFTTLTVSRDYLTAKGRGVGPSPWGSGAESIPLAQIRWIGLIGRTGLFVSQGITQNTCVLPMVDAAEAKSVIAAMLRRFPAYAGKIADAQLAGTFIVSAPAASTAFTTALAAAPLAPSSVPVPPAPAAATVIGQPAPSAAAKPVITTLPGWATIAIEDEAGELRFTKETGRLDNWLRSNVSRILWPIFLLALVLIFYRYWKIALPIALATSALIFFSSRKRAKYAGSTILSVNSQRMMATGDGLKADWMGNHTLPGTVTVSIDEIKYFGYSWGDEYSASGLWINAKHVSQCVIGCNRQQATAISVAILRKFPEYTDKCKNDI
jgi:hypothetical protein